MLLSGDILFFFVFVCSLAALYRDRVFLFVASLLSTDFLHHLSYDGEVGSGMEHDVFIGFM